MKSSTSSLLPLACTSKSLHDLSRPLDLTSLATVPDLSPSIEEGDDDSILKDSWYARLKDNTYQYYSSDEETEEVAWLTRKICNSSSRKPRMESFLRTHRASISRWTRTKFSD
ncbi:hypothetical protein NE237_001210 [Protea cynaroides]|uniref:Uncharacterized protein n=1 Tax=Protea cynaroides TaxID=273540 RepID=A0A9Q0KTQ0_9MAGN|nr:hypothetical protein NE237_001210 [Protea cynaroides]